ncbi:hypothetical protein GCM10011324_44840 [Allosediminivita pacifica]|nr:hypothetical protein GCM10011324_44840 [Allosediminivita pacifica]
MPGPGRTPSFARSLRATHRSRPRCVPAELRIAGSRNEQGIAKNARNKTNIATTERINHVIDFDVYRASSKRGYVRRHGGDRAARSGTGIQVDRADCLRGG